MMLEKLGKAAQLFAKECCIKPSRILSCRKQYKEVERLTALVQKITTERDELDACRKLAVTASEAYAAAVTASEAEIIRLQEAEAATRCLVLSHEGRIEKLQAELDAAKARITTSNIEMLVYERDQARSIAKDIRESYARGDDYGEHDQVIDSWKEDD